MPVMTPWTARGLLSGRTARVGPDDSLERVITLLSKDGVSNLPVVESRRLVGIISEWDCLRWMALDHHADLFEAPTPKVGAVMNRKVRSIDADADLQTLAHVFVTDRFHRVPVVEKDGKLLGMLGRGDILAALKKARTQRHKRDQYPDYRRPA